MASWHGSTRTHYSPLAYLQPDSTSHLMRAKNPAGTISQMVTELASGSIRAAGGANGPDTAATAAQVAAPFACGSTDALGGAGGCITVPAATTPGGSNTQVQFNDSGAFGGNSGFTFNKATGNVGFSYRTCALKQKKARSDGNRTARFANSDGDSNPSWC